MKVVTMPPSEIEETQFERELNERIKLQEEMILYGQFPGGYDRYQRECGILQGLRDARDVLEQVRYSREERERGG